MNGLFGTVVILGLVLIGVFAALGSNMPAFNPALEAWTKWFASIVAIMVSARVFWAAAAWVEAKAARLKP